MQSHEYTLPNAGVVAAFNDQSDIEAAIRQLRRAGFRNRHLGYFVWHPPMGLTNVLDRTAGSEGAIVGAVAGAVLGIWSVPLLSDLFVSVSGVQAFVELALFCTICAALLFGFIGWEIGAHMHESRVQMPAIDPAEGPFILTVNAGAASEQVWSILRQHGGHEPHAITAPNPEAV